MSKMRYRLAITRGICTACETKGDAIFLGIRAPFKQRIYLCPDCIVKAVQPKEEPKAEEPREDKDAQVSKSNEVSKVSETTSKARVSTPRKRRSKSVGSKAQTSKKIVASPDDPNRE